MASDDEGMPVDSLVATVKAAVRRAGVSRSVGQDDLAIKSVQLTLYAFSSGSAGGELDLRVPLIGVRVAGGASIANKDMHTIDMVLKPGPPRREVRGGNVDEVLVNAIRTIRRTVALAAAGDDPWTLSASTVDISFGVTRSGSISLGARGEGVSEHRQTLRITFVPASAQPS